MPKDANDHGTEVEQPRRAQSVRTQEGNTRSWLKLPAPIKRVFDEFPLRTYPANELPQRTTTARDRHTLHVFATEDGARNGKPSCNPGCLKWQTYLKFQQIDFQCVPSSNHASPTGALPFLTPAISNSDTPPPVSSSRIQRWVREQKDVKKSKVGRRPSRGDDRSSKATEDGPLGKGKPEQELSSDMRYDAYMSLLSHNIRNAYLYSLYLSPLNFDAVAYPLYIAPTTSNSLVRFTLSYQLRSTAEAELLKQAAVIDVQSLHRESERAFSALSTLLGDDEYFFGDEQPSLFDASVFAYTNILLDKDVKWQVRHLIDGLEKHGNLVKHRARILQRYYGTNV